MKIRITFFLFLLQSVLIYAAQVDTVSVKSASMNKQVPNLIVFPEEYETQKKAFPVLYLLHGATADFTYWNTRVPELKKYASTYNLIIVCPDAGYTSWYFDSPIDETMKYETYITKELVPYIDKNYKTIADRKGRAITGGSMGGHGAFYLAFRNQEIWGAAGSMIGGLDIRPFPNNWNIKDRLGSYAENKEVWNEHAVINMVHLLEGDYLKLMFDCGTSDFFYDVNLAMHKKLTYHNIPHQYIERPGSHTSDYLIDALKYHLVFVSDFFNAEQ